MDATSKFLDWEKDADLVEYRNSCLEFIKENCEFHCVCFRNPEKHRSMKTRYEAMGLNVDIYEGVPHTDPRILNGLVTSTGTKRNISAQLQRLWSVTYGHIDMIAKFYDSGKPYGIFGEDDVFINRTLPFHLPHIMTETKEMGLDVLLLGYMKTHGIESWMQGHALIAEPRDRPYRYHEYPDDQWGVHLYMVSRSGAKKILDAFAYGYADIHVDDPNKPFSPDWTVTKCPGIKRGLITPMFAVEDGKDPYEHYAHDGQYNFHMETTRFNYIPGVFI
jgi:hypothetical protein